MRTTNRPATVGAEAGADPAQPTTRLVIADGTLEALKWLALVLMTLDHINKFLYAGMLPFAFEAGRLVMPLFAFILGFNMARPQAMAREVQVRTIGRLLVFGLLATPPFVVLLGWWPLNILFTLATSVAIIHLLERGGMKQQIAALALFGVAGLVVEFAWFGMLCCVSAWAYCRRPTNARLTLWLVAVVFLWAVNHNLWAGMVVPLVLAAPHLTFQVRRSGRFFYFFYPAHLAVMMVAARHAVF